MKRCPECRRDYFDDSLVFCLDDGARLLEGPALSSQPTLVLPVTGSGAETVAKHFDNRESTDENLNAMHDPSRRTRLLSILAGAIVLVAIVGWGAYNFPSRGQTGQFNSIAVMPFVNEGGNPDLEYLSDGITESLINSLSQVPALAVKARSSVFTYKGKEATPQQVAKDLSVQAVLNGRVTQRGDQVVMSVELVDAATGNQIWGDKYSRRMTDLVHLQSEIARDVSGKLRAKLTGTEQQKVAKNYTENTEAYQLYLRGRYHWNKRKPDDIRRSVEYFQQAIDKDPAYALAYAALAETYILIPNYRVGKPADYYPKARAAAIKAIEMDNSLAEAHNALASVVANYDWKFSEAEAEWKKALELNPNYASAHQWYGEFLSSMGRYPEALAEMRRAQELDPLSLIINALVGLVLHHNGQTAEGIEQLQKTLEMDPNFPRTHLYLAEIYQSTGRFDEAADEFAKNAVLNGVPPEEIAQLAARVKNAARTGGEKAYSRALAEILEKNPANGIPPPPWIIASHWGKAGDLDRAFAVLEKAYQEHDDTLLMLKDRRLDALKGDPRYRDLLRRIGLPE